MSELPRTDDPPLDAERVEEAFAEFGERVRELESVGVDQFNIYLMTGQQESTLEVYGDEIIPKFASVPA